MRYFAIIFAITFIGVTAFYLTGFGSTQDVYNDRAFDEVVDIHASFNFFETTLEGLKSRAPNIVRARVADDAAMVFQFNDMFRPTELTIGHNVVSIEILEVIKGEISVGDVIRIIEPYFIYNGVLYTMGNYMPSIPHEEYFFFLYYEHTHEGVEEFIGAFPIIHGDRGRYRVPSARAAMHSYSAADLSIGTARDSDLYMRLWQEVIDAFMN